MTLIELLVTLALLAIISAVATPAIRKPAVRLDDPAIVVRDSSRAATMQRRSITWKMDLPSSVSTITARPDGSVFADSLLFIDPLTGIGAHAR